MCSAVVFVFFFKQKTAYEMRISDWSSDVCSSDLWRVGDVRGRLNIAAFRNWYDDAVNYINVTGFVPVDDPSFPDRGSFGFNAADLTISGIDIDGKISPTPGVVFCFYGTYLDPKVKSVTNVDPFTPVSVTLPSPEFSYTTGWDFKPPATV